MRSFCRDVCNGLGRQSRTRFALPARHDKSISCRTLALTEFVCVCTVRVLFPSRRVGIAPPPHFLVLYRCYSARRSAGIAPTPPPIFFDWDCVLSLHVAAQPEESITLRLMMVAPSRLLLVPEGSLIPVLSMLGPLSTECL